MICRDGTGEFEAQSHSGVSVRVGAARSEGLAARICEAEINWGDQKLVVAPEAVQLDIDAFGVDMGLAAPVVALQIKNAKADCCMVYDIYSLRAPPTLLRTISGGEFFSAADTDLVGRVEIWTDDARAVDGFENMALRDLDFAPPVVLRFVRGRLLDVGIEFRPYYDQRIAEERVRLDPQDLADFKNSDGRLTTASGIPAVRLVQLRKVKMKVLEIVWCYLYSGREKEGLRVLGEMWPPRIRTGSARRCSTRARTASAPRWTAFPPPFRPPTPRRCRFTTAPSPCPPRLGWRPRGQRPKWRSRRPRPF